MCILIGWLLINHISVPVIPERICVKAQELSQDRNIPVTEEAELYMVSEYFSEAIENA